MKLELPDNNASVLFHMGNALQSIARDIDTSLSVNGHKITHAETACDVSHSVTVEPLVKLSDAELSDVERYGQAWKEHYESIKDDENPIEPINDNTTVEVSDTIDADGLPWDKRINSKGRTRIKGDVWRARQKPNDKSDEEWAEYVEGVKTELRALMVIPVATGAELDVLANTPVITAEQRAELEVHVDYTEDPNEVDPFAIEPPVVDAVVTPPVDAAVVTPPVVDAVVTPPVVDAVVTPPVVDAVIAPPVDAAVIAPPVDAAVIAPPVDAAVIAPPVDAAVVTTGPTTFPELMKFITVNNKKLTKESVDEALKAQGLASIALLAARTDLIPQVHAALVELL